MSSLLPAGAGRPEKRRQRDFPPKQPSSRKASTAKVRVSHACDRCRIMRTKCSGGDRCTKCTKDEAACVYGDRKRERNKKDLAESLDRIGSLEGDNLKMLEMLRVISERPDFRPDENGDMLDMLAKYAQQEEDDQGADSSSQSQSQTWSAPINQATSPSSGPSRKAPRTGEKHAASSVGSPGKQGILQRVVSLDNGGGASGLVGKMSEISWIQRAFEIVRGMPTGDRKIVSTAELDEHLLSTTDFIYFMDDTNVLAVDEDYVEDLHWPSKDTVVLLSEAFFYAMQGAYHFVDRETFLQKAFLFSIEDRRPTWDQRRWLAMANLVWAIGSKWLQMTQLDDRKFNEDHRVYYARARALGLDHRVMFDHPDIDRVQGIGLLSFYLLINGSITRAWNTLGHATRHATALGLHLRVSDDSVDELEKARRARTWYSLYSLEILITEITGRPKSISLVDVTIPIELFWSIPQESAESVQVDNFMSTAQSKRIWLEHLHASQNMSQMTGGVVPWKSFSAVGRNVPTSYLPHRLYLCRISDQIASQLYTATSDIKWSEIQSTMGRLQNVLKHWEEQLPEELTFQGHGHAETDPRAKLELSMYHHSVEMMLHRICLCEIVIDDESNLSHEFNRSAARACVHAAMSMLALLPDYPTTHEAFQLLPWWALLHFITQATSVILLEMSLGAQHFPDDVPQLLQYLRKAMAYIWCMAEGSLSAYRCWRSCRQLLSEVLEHHDDWDLADIPMEAVQPPGWNERLEAATMKALSREW